MLRRALHAVGYLIAPVLFAGAHTPTAVASRLRLAYRLVGVRIVETPRVDAVERTIFLCPYRNLAASWVGAKWLCHDILDRVDDGYVTYLRRHRDLDYDRVGRNHLIPASDGERHRVPGPLIAGLFSYLLGTELPGRGTNYLKQALRYPQPAYYDEELTATVRVTRLRPGKALVNLRTTCTTADGRVVCDGEALVLAKDTGHFG
jgi:hypothetical protein